MLQLKKEWCEIEEIIGVAISRFPNLSRSHYLQVAVDPGLALLKADPALVAVTHPALVVLDLGLPDIDGTEVVHRVREWSKVPIIILSVRELETAVWGHSYETETHYLRVYVGQLRRKLEKNPSQPEHLLTASGVGYRLV